jgi:hypothetical protein
MNKAKLRSYAPQARKDFIAAVTARANLLGLSEKAGKLEVATSQPQGDATVIAGQAWPVKVHSQRQQLIARIQKDGFALTMEAIAYTWFNRFAALRYMELHDYLGHGHRALSSVEGTLPDILSHATDLAQNGAADGGLPGLKPELVVEMKLAGNRDGELYSMLLVAQCNALSNAMPFLFERIDDETELLLPDNLLRTDSVIARLVASIEEEDWKEVEIIGWLYQFYISEKKDEVIGTVVKSEDIPAATQLFTPNWIVQYLVQNSVGRLWLTANPASTLKAQWPYYITPADQTPEVQAQLHVLTQTRVNEDGGSLNPESITLLDPACGSGHILVEAYEVFKAIYLERGYQLRSIPRLVLEKNLFGLDIDDRAAQMAGFALLMKARADDRRLFNEPVNLNVLSLRDSKGLNADELSRALQSITGAVSPPIYESAGRSGFVESDLFPSTLPQYSLGESSAAYMVDNPLLAAIPELVAIFSHAKTFGSLIQIPKALNVQSTTLLERLQFALRHGDLYAKAAAQDLLPLVVQARMLGMQFDAVVANPPYMGGNGMNQQVKDYTNEIYPDSKSDLFAMFIERGFYWCKPTGFNSMVTMQSWMFLSSFEAMRRKIIGGKTISTFVQIGYNSFPEMNSKIAQACAFSIFGSHIDGFVGRYVNLNLAPQSADKNIVFLERGKELVHDVNQADLKNIPGSPVAYWMSQRSRKCFEAGVPLDKVGRTVEGTSTGENNRFLRYWYEVDARKLRRPDVEAATHSEKWVFHNKGGGFRRWYGNSLHVMNWEFDGDEISKHSSSSIRGRNFFFKTCASWGRITSGELSVRWFPAGYTFDSTAPSIFAEAEVLMKLLGFLNSRVVSYLLKGMSPTIDFRLTTLGRLPILLTEEKGDGEKINQLVEKCIAISEQDWNSFETSFDFEFLSLVSASQFSNLLAKSWELHNKNSKLAIRNLQELEEENNRIFLKAYGLEGELASEVSEDQITLARADREKDCQRLISYAIGCMMGRYCLKVPGLIYAQASNVGFDSNRSTSFPADADGIVPVSDELWFEDEAASRIREFVLAVWGAETVAENMAWLAESLGVKVGETPDETIRRYLASKFYKDHLQTYKKRPIYWLFNSGKQGAFQALVYLHRYHEGTLSRMRAEYVVPLTGKIQSRIEMLEKDAAAVSSIAARNKLSKEVEKLKKKHVELLAYDEKLRNYADMRITLDLDDGVKVNYGKFGDLLAEVTVVTGGASDD